MLAPILLKPQPIVGLITSVTPTSPLVIIESPKLPLIIGDAWRRYFVELRLDYLSCVLTVVSTILIGRRYWEGWILAGINSVIICVIALHTEQLGFIPANLFCLVLYGFNLRSWRKAAH